MSFATLCNLCSIFPSKNRLRFLPRTFCRVPFFRFSRIVSRVHAVTFAVRLPKRLQRSLHTVLSRFKRSKFSACTFVHFAPFQAVTWQQTWQNAVIRGRGPPWGAGREAQLSPHRIFYFLFPKFFFWKIPLSSLFMPPSSMPKPAFFWFRSVYAYPRSLVEARICSKKRHFSHFLLKDE